MQYRSIASLAVVALAAQVTAQQTRVFTRATQSLRQQGIFRRQDDGYKPEDEICSGEGSTCAEVCGDGYEQCASSDSSVHCFSPATGESCCSTGSGSKFFLFLFFVHCHFFANMTDLPPPQGSCLAAFYCTHDTDLATWCCPEGQDLEQCANVFGVTSGLVLDVPAEPIASVAPVESSSSQAPESTSEVVIPSSSAVAEETSSYVPPSSSSSIIATSSIPWFANSTTPTYHVPSATAPVDDEEDDVDDEDEEDNEEDVIEDPETEPTPSQSPEEGSADTVHGSASLALVAGIAFAALLF